MPLFSLDNQTTLVLVFPNVESTVALWLAACKQLLLFALNVQGIAAICSKCSRYWVTRFRNNRPASPSQPLHISWFSAIQPVASAYLRTPRSNFLIFMDVWSHHLFLDLPHRCLPILCFLIGCPPLIKIPCGCWFSPPPTLPVHATTHIRTEWVQDCSPLFSASWLQWTDKTAAPAVSNSGVCKEPWSTKSDKKVMPLLTKTQFAEANYKQYTCTNNIHLQTMYKQYTFTNNWCRITTIN